jgi:hypothetical protein
MMVRRMKLSKTELKRKHKKDDKNSCEKVCFRLGQLVIMQGKKS